MNTTIASLLAPEKLAELMKLAGEGTEPENVPTELTLVDALCQFCGADLKIALPIVGTIACAGCDNQRPVGKKQAVRPGVDLSNYSDAELGRLVRAALHAKH